MSGPYRTTPKHECAYERRYTGPPSGGSIPSALVCRMCGGPAPFWVEVLYTAGIYRLPNQE